MTLAEFEKLLDETLMDHWFCEQTPGDDDRQRVLDAFAAARQSADDASDGCNHFKIAYEKVMVQRDAARVEADALRQAMAVCLEAIDAAHADPEAGLPSKAWHWWSAARAALSAPRAEEPSR